jgi:hypothetical protein
MQHFFENSSFLCHLDVIYSYEIFVVNPMSTSKMFVCVRWCLSFIVTQKGGGYYVAGQR